MPIMRMTTPAGEAVAGFLRHLADRGFAVSTRRIRGHFLDEYAAHVLDAAGGSTVTVADLMDPARSAAWLTDAASGKTRTRNTFHGPDAAAFSNSMRVRIDTFNAFAEFLGLPNRLDTPPPADGDFLSAADSERLLHNLAVRRPVQANATTSVRTAAVAALVADTGRSVPDLAGLKLTALHLDDDATLDLDDEHYPLRDETVSVLRRWLAVRSAIIDELEGSDPGHLWIPTKPGRPRGGQPPVKPGLTPAAVRTLHHAHRTLVSQVLGTPLRPGALRGTRIPEPAQPDEPPPGDEG